MPYFLRWLWEVFSKGLKVLQDFAKMALLVAGFSWAIMAIIGPLFGVAHLIDEMGVLGALIGLAGVLFYAGLAVKYDLILGPWKWVLDRVEF